MDHIPLWSDQLGHEPIEVPYLRDAKFRYDDQGFLTYPHRVGVDTTKLSGDTALMTRLLDSFDFLQAWLWFGLLGEALRVGSRETTAPKRLSSATFTKYIGDRQFLSTRTLKECIRADLAMHTSPCYRQFQIGRIDSCVQVATSFMRGAVSKFSHEVLTECADDHKSRDVIHLLLACQILCETLVESYDIELKRPATGYVQERQSLHIVDHLLRRSGWCPRQIEGMPSIVSFRYYLSFCRNKTRCSYFKEERRSHCLCDLSKERKQVPKHTLEHCSCIQLEAPSADAKNASQENKTALCRFQNRDGGQISLVFQNLDELGSTPYIAISHVRCAGLGNSAGNSLPLCQVALLQKLVDEVAKGFGVGPETLFWIDTLCLHRTKHRQEATLTAARHIFATAKAVLVLDPPLYLHTFSSSQEALIRIRYSTWKERLWTLEEGSTAQSLVFRFSHGMVTLKELLRSAEEAPPCDLLKNVIRRIRPWPLAHNLPEYQVLPRLVERFADDLQALRRDSQRFSAFTLLDQQKLKRMLRLGYLASPVFRYFIHEDEYDGILAIWEPLLKAYGGPGFEGQEGPADENNLHHVVGRLITLSSTQLPA